MKILLISTLDSNPGDEFIRLGQEYLLRQLYPRARFVVVHKHDPRSLFADFSGASTRVKTRLMPLIYLLYEHTYGRGRENLLETADLVVFAGTPFIWRSDAWPLRSTCANAEWVGATWKKLFTQLPEKPVLNLAAGASFSKPSQIDSLLGDAQVTDFLRRAVSRSALTTARDVVTRRIFGSLGFDVEVLPCTSIFAAKAAGIRSAKPEYVAVNLMPGAVHSWRGQRTDTEKWRSIIGAVIPEIEKRHPVLFVSHSRDEDEAVAKWFPGRRRFFSTKPNELLQAYSRAQFGLCNRVHAAAAIAAFGRPAIVVGGDSRIELLSEFGLPAFDYREINAPDLMKAIALLEDDLSSLADELRKRSITAEDAYLRAINRALAPRLPISAGVQVG